MTTAIPTALGANFLSASSTKTSKIPKNLSDSAGFSQVLTNRSRSLPSGVETLKSDSHSVEGQSNSTAAESRRVENRRQSERQQEKLRMERQASALTYGPGLTQTDATNRSGEVRQDEARRVDKAGAWQEPPASKTESESAEEGQSGRKIDASATGSLDEPDSESAVGSNTNSVDETDSELTAEQTKVGSVDPSVDDESLSEEFAGLLAKAATVKSRVAGSLGRAENIADEAGRRAVDEGGREARQSAAATDWVEALASSRSSSNQAAYDFLRSAPTSAMSSSVFGRLGEDQADFGETLTSEIEALSSIGLPSSVGREGALGSTTTAIREALGQPRWTEAFSERVEWLIGQRVQKATILVNPTNLGPIEVSISIEGNKTHAMFFSQNPQVREAIEASLPQLHQMLTDAGVSLGNAGVSSETFAGGDDSGAAGEPKTAHAVDEVRNEVATAYLTTLGPTGSRANLFGETLQLVDTFV